MRVLIIHNVASGFGSDAIYEFLRHLQHEGDECVVRILNVDAPDHGRSMLTDAEDFDLVVVSGGDGTVATLLYILRNRGVLTCVFPSGTANLYFLNLGNSADPSAIARACRVGHSASCDLGEIMWFDEWGVKRRQGFSIMAGIGFDAQIMQTAIPAKRTMGQAAYFAAALKHLRPEVQNFRIVVDGEEYESRGIGCIVANNAMIQGEVDLIPGCTMCDGQLDVLVLEADVTPQLLHPILTGFVDHDGKKVRPHLRSFSGTDIEIRAKRPLNMEIDGDPMEGLVSRYRARCIPGANQIVVDPLSRYAAANESAAPLFGHTDEIAFPQ